MDFFHIADHSYAHLALLFPHDRVGVYCHDIDAFRALLPGSKMPWSRIALSRLLLTGLRHAKVVFFSTNVVRDEILRSGFLAPSRLVKAPPGIAEEYLDSSEHGEPRQAYLMHVGTCTPRKNIGFLLRVMTHLKRRNPNFRLVQVGGHWTQAQSQYVKDNLLAEKIEQVRGLTRQALATLYRGAAAVLVPSLAEGFGLPVIEALSCGAPVLASDIPVLREVASGGGVSFLPLESPDQWAKEAANKLAHPESISADVRQHIWNRYTWSEHARCILNGYERSS